MPFVEPEIAEDFKCQNKNCGHSKITHSEDGECDLCACFEFVVPREMRPHWEADPSKWSLRWACEDCFRRVYGMQRKLGLTTKEPKKCSKCGESRICVLMDRGDLGIA